jgi:hypothetical protein
MGPHHIFIGVLKERVYQTPVLTIEELKEFVMSVWPLRQRYYTTFKGPHCTGLTRVYSKTECVLNNFLQFFCIILFHLLGDDCQKAFLFFCCNFS